MNIVIFLNQNYYNDKKSKEMQKSCFSVINKQFSNRQSLYLKDPQSDLYVVLAEKIYPLHKSFVREIEYFNAPEHRNQKIIIIDPSLDAKNFQLILGYFYGKQLQFFRNWELDKALQIITYLSISNLSKIIINDFKNNFDQYGFFLLLAIAYKYKIAWLKDKCEQQLILMEFEQLNYNRYDLFQLDRDTFEEIIKFHQLLRVNQNIVGLKDSSLKKIIKQYCNSNNIPPIQINKLSNYFQSSSPTSQTKLSFEQSVSIRKRNSSVPNQNVLNTIEADTPHKSCQITVFHPQQTNKKEEYEKLKLINEQIQQKNNKLLQQIENVKQSLSKSKQVRQHDSQTEGFDEKIKKFEKMCEQQDEKCLILKNEMQKFSPKSKVDPEKQLNQSLTCSTNTVKNSRKKSETVIQKSSFLASLPVLSRDQDS